METVEVETKKHRHPHNNPRLKTWKVSVKKFTGPAWNKNMQGEVAKIKYKIDNGHSKVLYADGWFEGHEEVFVDTVNDKLGVFDIATKLEEKDVIRLEYAKRVLVRELT